MNPLLNAFSAEQQAIAIYEAQVFWRPGASGLLFREVLSEERQHRNGIEPYIKDRRLKLLVTPFNILAGWLFGTVLSLMPRKFCYQIHVWAEKEAAKTYEQTAIQVANIVPKQLLESLHHAAIQEHEHAARFAALIGQLNGRID